MAALTPAVQPAWSMTVCQCSQVSSTLIARATDLRPGVHGCCWLAAGAYLAVNVKRNGIV